MPSACACAISLVTAGYGVSWLRLNQKRPPGKPLPSSSASVSASKIEVSTDGTVAADGFPVARLGLVAPADPTTMTREDGVRFDPGGAVVPVLEGAVIHQGFVEGANVSPIQEITRMIEVQRAYELGQNFLDQEDERMRQAIRVIGAQA